MVLIDRTVPRVVIDTNAALDWLVFAEPAALALADALAERRWSWCATQPMLDELRAVLNRPLVERWESARKLALTIDIGVIWVSVSLADEPAPPPQRLICTDSSDQMFIDLAVRCAPSWLVTRDRALLALRRRAAPRGVVVATPQQWWQRHAAIAVETI